MFSFLNKTKKFVPTLKKVAVFGCIVLVLVTASMGVFTKTASAQFFFNPLNPWEVANAVGEAARNGVVETGRDAVALFFSYISEILLRLSSLILYFAGISLKYIIQLSVVEMREIVNSAGVQSAWGTFRDIANMSFIFIILYVAISTILGTGINMRKTLVRVVVVALLLNFSFFFTKVAVDASNIFTVAFYNQIINAPCGADGKPAGDLGSAFMCHMGLSSIWSASGLIGDVGKAAATVDISNIIIRGIMGSLLFLITAFVFFAAGLMFLARFIAFIFLFMFSSLAFAAMAIPGGDKWTNQWKEALFKNCIFAPAFMLTVWATLKILGTINKTLFPAGATFDLSEAFVGINGGPVQNAGQTFLNYAIVIGMIIGSLIVAQKFGAYGAGGAIKMLDKTRKGIQGSIGRNSLGRFGYWADNKVGKADNWLGRRANSTLGRGLRGSTTGALAKAKFGSQTDFNKYAKDKGKADEDYGKEIRKKHKEKADFTYNQLQLNVEKAKNNAENELEIAKNPASESEIRKKTLETKLTKDRETLADLNAAQKTDEGLLEENKGTPGYSIIKNRIDDRATEIKKLDTQITSGPEAVELKAIETASKKAIEAAMAADKGVVAATEALAKFTKYNEEEAKKLFTTSGKEKGSEEKGKKMGLSSSDLEDFMEIERRKYVKEIKELMEGSGQGKNKKNPDPVRVQLMRDAGEYSRRGALASTIRKSLREGEGKKTKDIIKDLMNEEGIKGKDEDDEGGGEGKDGGDKGGGEGGDKGKKGK